MNEPTTTEEATRPAGLLGSLKALMTAREAPVYLGLILGTLIFIPIGFAIASSSQDNYDRTDPRIGVVTVKDSNGQTTGVSKVCDGTTLVYLGGVFGSDDAVVNSPECQ